MSTLQNIPSPQPAHQQHQQQQPIPQPSILNPFSQSGAACASELDYNHGFPKLFLSAAQATDFRKFRVDVTNFEQMSNATQPTSSPRRVINNEATLATILRDGSVTLANNGAVHAHQGWAQINNSNHTVPRNGRVSIITIPQEFSNGPLDITKSAMQNLITTLDIPMSFLPVLYAFGSVPRLSEAGLDCFTCIKDPADTESFTLCYLYRFKEIDDRGPDNTIQDWRDRQIGVFHRYCASRNESLFVILQPHANSFFDGRIEDVQASIDGITTLLNSPLCLHQLLITSYFGGWREYLKNVAEEFDKSSAEAFTQDIVKDYSIGFDFLQHWRDTADRITPIPATLDSITRIVKGLRSIQNATYGGVSMSRDFEIFGNMMLSQSEGLRHSAEMLAKRIANITDLLSDTIDIKNQTDAATLNGHMETLTQDTVDDSSSVRIITILSMIYLPGSFIATLFGMNLFVFNQNTQRLVIARDFWLYIVLFVPLTVLTFAAAAIMSKKAQKQRLERTRGVNLLALR